MTNATKLTKAQARKISLAKLIAALENYRQYASKAQRGMIDNVDALTGLQGLDDNFATAMVTDPPYGIDLAEWDGDVPGVDIWKVAFRVLTREQRVRELAERKHQRELEKTEPLKTKAKHPRQRTLG